MFHMTKFHIKILMWAVVRHFLWPNQIEEKLQEKYYNVCEARLKGQILKLFLMVLSVYYVLRNMKYAKHSKKPGFRKLTT